MAPRDGGTIIGVWDWLQTLGELDWHVRDDEAWYIACQKGQRHAIDWLLHLGMPLDLVREGRLYSEAANATILGFVPDPDLAAMAADVLAGPDPEEHYITGLCQTIMRDGMIWASHPCHCHPTLIAWLLALGIPDDLVRRVRETATPEIAAIIDSRIPTRRAKSIRSGYLWLR